MEQIYKLIFIMLIALSSCQPFTVEEALLEGKPCALPCWYDIEVGETSYDTAISTLESHFSIENISFPRDDSILVCHDAELCSPSISLGADDNGVITEIVVGFEAETVLCAELYQVYGMPDMLVDAPAEQSTVIFYDEAQIEIILVIPEVTPNRRWLEFMFIREESAYINRKTALHESAIFLSEDDYSERYCLP